MKKAILSLLMATASLISFSQNWVEVGVDTSYGRRFNATDIIMLNDSIGYLAGYAVWSDPFHQENIRSILKTSDGGATWDSLKVLKGGSLFGKFFNFNYTANQLYALVGLRSLATRPNDGNYADEYGLFEDFENDSEWDTLLSNKRLNANTYLTTFAAINDSIIVCALEDYSNGNGSVINGYCYITRFNKNIGVFDTLITYLPDTVEFIKEMFFLDDQHGYLACGSFRLRNNGYLFYTQNGGENWQVMKESFTGSQYNSVKFYDQQTGILGGEEGLYFTSNGGFDWFPAIGISSRFKAEDIALVGNVAYAIGSFEYYDGSSRRYKTHIYKSLDKGKEWCMVFEDTLENVGASAKTMHISFSNENHGVAAYGYNRLIYTTNGGGLTECVTGINEAEETPLLVVYPNPSNGSFTISLPSDLKAHDLRIYDLSGGIVQQMQVSSSSMSVNGLASGMYILQVQTAEGVLTQKLVVE